MAKKIEHICNNCKLYDPVKGHCVVVIIHKGDRINVPMAPEDSCLFEGNVFDPKTGKTEDLTKDIKQVRFWVEDAEGKKTDKKGTVMMEYPEGFFGKPGMFEGSK